MGDSSTAAAAKWLGAIAAVGFVGVLILRAEAWLPPSTVWPINVFFVAGGLIGFFLAVSGEAPTRTQRAISNLGLGFGWLLITVATVLIVVIEIETHSRS